MNKPVSSRLIPALLLTLMLSACSNMQAPAQKSLYERLGGQPAIQAVVDDFIGNVAGDTRINAFFAHTDIAHLNKMLVEQICQATGGPCTYTGRSMKAAHASMNIQNSHFNALVEDLAKSLNKFNVPQKEQNELLSALAAMKSDIVAQ